VKGTLVRSALTVDLPRQPDLAATMDIQIPALAWKPTAAGYCRTFYLDGRAVPVEVYEGRNALHFTYDTDPGRDVTLRRLLPPMFPTMAADLDLRSHPALRALRDQYSGVILMRAEPFEALVLTVLSQNRSGETVRAVFPTLADAAGGITPARLSALGLSDLTRLIRSAGPYKAPRLAETVRRIHAEGPEVFDKTIREAPTPQALAYLEALPGVAHKTAACILVFAAGTRTTLPVDTHLFRVADRIGLAPHNGRLTPASRASIISNLLSYGADLAPAHFLFLLVGRSTCTAGTPDCVACFLRPHCAHAVQHRSPGGDNDD
jgi:endonuclease III